jgi:hypothetical protein
MKKQTLKDFKEVIIASQIRKYGQLTLFTWLSWIIIIGLSINIFDVFDIYGSIIKYIISIILCGIFFIQFQLLWKDMLEYNNPSWYLINGTIIIIYITIAITCTIFFLLENNERIVLLSLLLHPAIYSGLFLFLVIFVLPKNFYWFCIKLKIINPFMDKKLREKYEIKKQESRQI